MIPITIENDETVRKADLTKPWYSYENKKWANAVILQNSYDALSTEGKVNSATKQDGYVSFDGIDDYIDLGLADYDLNKEFTIAMKVRINEFNNSGTRMLLTNFETGGISFEYYNSLVYANIYKEDYSGYITTPKYTYESNQFFLINATYDGEKFSLFVDGNLLGSVSYSGKILSSKMPFVIGANPNANNTFAQYGKTDVKQVVIYNRTLSEEEVKNNMSDDIKVTDSTGLLKYVDFTNKQNYESKEVIPEDVIESYFVWIPKYRYKLWNVDKYTDVVTTTYENKANEIQVLFGDYNTDDSISKECTTPMTSGVTGNCKVGDYMTHPAFISIPSTGFWVGKFETGYKGAEAKETAESNTYDISKVEIKPNVYSWRGIQVANAHLNSYNYKRSLDSHMMKNTEWGAVAYLTYSKYGLLQKQRLNNNENFITGYAANNEPTCVKTGKNDSCNIYCSDNSCNSPYNTSIGYLASSTGNIYGIYDMSGGAIEYTMSFLGDNSGHVFIGQNEENNSNFNGLYVLINSSKTDGISLPDIKYYDFYGFSQTHYDYEHRILGDGTGEYGPFYRNNENSNRLMSSWFKSEAHFVSYKNGAIFFANGNSYSEGENASLFTFGSLNGTAQIKVSYRIILTPTT